MDLIGFSEFKKKYERKKVEEVPNEASLKPMVSICVQTFQHVNFIRTCLEGILCQKTTFSFEILLGEDCSTDGTREICLEYARKYPDKIRLFLHHRDNNISIGGSATGRFVFMSNLFYARGKYIALCEGDDCWTDPLKLQKQVEFLEKNPDFIITYHDANIVDYQGNIIKEGKLPKRFRRDMDKYFLQTEGYILTLTMLFRNIISGFPPEFATVLNGDKFLVSLLGGHGRGKYMGEILNGHYRRHSGGIWTGLKRKGSKYLHHTYTFLALHEFHQRIGNNRVSKYYYNRYTKTILLLCGTDAYKQDFKSLLKHSKWFLNTEVSSKKKKLLKTVFKNLIKGVVK